MRSLRNKWLVVPFLLLVLFATVGADDCDEDVPKSDQQRLESVQDRAENFARAEAKYPQPRQQNFPMREALVKYTQRQDLLNHPWYIYVQISEFNDPPVFVYYIGQTYPQSTCNFLGSTEELDRNSNGTAVLTAPSLDGIFYGGGGSNGGGCDYFFFDLATDKMVVLQHDWKWFTSDGLLIMDARPISVRQ